MKILFEHDGHKIVVVRGIVTSELIIDAVVSDTCNGFTNNQVKTFRLSGATTDSNGETVDIQILVAPKLFHDDITLYYSGKLIETKTASFF